MKKIIYLLWVILILSSCGTVPNIISSNPEPVDIQTNSKEINIDKTFADRRQINAIEYTFPFEVEEIAVDTAEMKALVFTRVSERKSFKKPGILIYYDLKKQEVAWSKKSFCWDPKFFLDDKIIIQGNGKVFAISKYNGEMLWERKGNYFLYNEENKVGFTGSLTAFSLDTGKDMWQWDLDRKFGWDEIKFIGSKLIVAADGLHLFDLKTGQGWDFKMMTGKTNEGGAIAASVGLSILSGLVGGGVVTVNAKVWSNMTSNILYEDNSVFFSAKDQFVCVDMETGNKVWRVVLPEKESAKVFIHFDGDNIVLVNTGSCLNEGKVIIYGKPYIAKYEKSTGNQIFFNLLNVKSPVKDVFISENGYYIISDETFSHYDADGNEKARLRYDDDSAREKYGNFLYFSGDGGLLSGNYIQDLVNYTPLSNYYQYNLMPMAVTDKGVIIFNDDYKIKNWIMNQQVFYPIIKTNSKKIFRNHTYLINDSMDESINDVYLIDEQGNDNGSLSIKQTIEEMNNYIYYKNNNTLTLIPKSSL